MSLNQEKLEKYFKLWIEYAKSCLQNDLEAFLAHLKQTVNDFLNEKAAELDETEKGALKERIEELLQDQTLLLEVLDLVPRMGMELCPGSEPIPGYTLTRSIGSGSYGEVWLANAPGGIEVALKFLPKSSLLSEFSSRKELEALMNIRNIRHVNLVPLSVIWENENPDYIVYQMGLSEENLTNHLRVSEHPQGIDAGTLLPYFQDAAAALDYLNRPTDGSHPAILHGDVKPDNIFVMENRALLGDFGSLRLLDSASDEMDGSYTPAFVAPERLNGKNHVNSDQYSLAASWYYLRTGYLPYSDAPITTIRAASREWLNSVLLKTMKTQASNAGSMTQNLNLSMFSSRERKVLARALAWNPEDRFKSCSDFIEELVPSYKVFAWIGLGVTLALLLTVGTFIGYQKIHFIRTANTVSIQLGEECVPFAEMSRVVEEVKTEWAKVRKKCDENPARQDVYLNDFAEILDGKIACWKYLTKEPLGKLSETNLETLNKNGISKNDLEILDTQLKPWVYEEFFGYLEDMKKYSLWYVQGDGMRRMGEANIDMLYLSFNYSVNLYYCSYLQWLTSLPETTQKKSRELLAKQHIALCNNLPTNWTEQEYMDKSEELTQNMKHEADKLKKIVDDVELDFEAAKKEYAAPKAEEQKFARKKEELEKQKEELAAQKQSLEEKEKHLLEMCVFQNDDTPWLMWGKMLRIVRILQLKLNSDGYFDHEEIYVLLQQKLDDLAQRCADDSRMVHSIQVAKRYYQCLEEGKIQDYGRIAYMFENDAIHPNLQSGDIVTEVNGHPIRNKAETDASWNSAEGAENVLTRLRFDEMGNPVFEKCTVPPGAPRIAYIELTEEGQE